MEKMKVYVCAIFDTEDYEQEVIVGNDKEKVQREAWERYSGIVDDMKAIDTLCYASATNYEMFCNGRVHVIEGNWASSLLFTMFESEVEV